MNSERTTLFLMANLGSELMRFFKFKEHGNIDFAEASAARALKIIEAVASRGESSAGREALVFKEIIDDANTAAPHYHISEKELNSYFIPLASRIVSK